MKRFAKPLLVTIMVIGIIIAFVNIQSTDLNAGQGYIEYKGTFAGHYSSCPGDPSNCTHRIYLDADTEDPGK